MSPPRRAAAALAALLAAHLGGCTGRQAEGGVEVPRRERSAAPAAPAASAPRTVADEFITTFWCGPPLQHFDDDRAREIADAGFTLVGATCEGNVNPMLNARALRIAGRHGLKMLIKDRRLSAAQPLTEGWQARADAALEAYRGRAALAGFFLLDEPSDGSIYPDIAALRQRIRKHDPSLIGYVNLLPDYVFAGPDDYLDYVASYLFRTQPDLLSYDHYPFLNAADRPSFFDNLATIREQSLEYEVPFLLIVQLMPHADYREATAAELAWQVYHALAFGARGISYFAYWTPTQVPDNLVYRFRRGIIEGGIPTVHYERVKVLNHRIRAVAAALEGYSSVAVWDSLGRAGTGAPAPDALAAVERGEVIAGTFRAPDGRTAMLVVNRDYEESALVRLRPPGAAVFDAEQRAWSQPVESVELPPGEGRLVAE